MPEAKTDELVMEEREPQQETSDETYDTGYIIGEMEPDEEVASETAEVAEAPVATPVPETEPAPQTRAEAREAQAEQRRAHAAERRIQELTARLSAQKDWGPVIQHYRAQGVSAEQVLAWLEVRTEPGNIGKTDQEILPQVEARLRRTQPPVKDSADSERLDRIEQRQLAYEEERDQLALEQETRRILTSAGFDPRTTEYRRERLVLHGLGKELAQAYPELTDEEFASLVEKTYREGVGKIAQAKVEQARKALAATQLNVVPTGGAIGAAPPVKLKIELDNRGYPKSGAFARAWAKGTAASRAAE